MVEVAGSGELLPDANQAGGEVVSFEFEFDDKGRMAGDDVIGVGDLGFVTSAVKGPIEPGQDVLSVGESMSVSVQVADRSSMLGQNLVVFSGEPVEVGVQLREPGSE